MQRAEHTGLLRKLYLKGVQELVSYAKAFREAGIFRRISVLRVSEYGVTDGSQLCANLMRTPGQELHFQEADAVLHRYRSVGGLNFLVLRTAFSAVNLHLIFFFVFIQKSREPLGLSDFSFDTCKIVFLKPFIPELHGKFFGRSACFCGKYQP